MSSRAGFQILQGSDMLNIGGQRIIRLPVICFYALRFGGGITEVAVVVFGGLSGRADHDRQVNRGFPFLALLAKRPHFESNRRARPSARRFRTAAKSLSLCSFGNNSYARE